MVDMVAGGATRKMKTIKTPTGKTFQIDSPQKKWTGTKKYKKWVRKLTRKQKKNSPQDDMCVGPRSICKDDLGIPRKYMPQFNTMAEITRFTKFVRKVYKIKSCKAKRTVNEMKASQSEISRPRVQSIIKEGALEHVYNPLVISGDNYVVDGHHRWAAYKLKKPNVKLPVVIIDAPIKDILGIAVAWGARHAHF